MTKKSFILYQDTYEHIEDLPLEDKGKLLDAIFKHAAGEPVEVKGVVGMAFSFIKKQMDRDVLKYENFCEKQRENGSKGGRPKNKPTGKTRKPKNPTVISETQKSLTVTDNVTDNVNVTDNIYTHFDEFWENYPRQRRGNKSKAESAFNKASERDEAHTILEGLAGYILSDEVEKGFAKGAEAWLNNDGWTNNYSAKPVKKDINHYVNEALGELDNGTF